MNNKTKGICLFSILAIILTALIETHLIESFDAAVYNLVTISTNDSLTIFLKTITLITSPPAISCAAVLTVIIGIIIKKRREGLCIFIVTIFNYIIDIIIKGIIQRPRPELMRMAHENSFSFPSGHALITASFCGMMIYLILKSEMNENLKKVLTVILVLMPLLTGISRVYLGAHYASDILGGFLIAILLLLIEISIIEKKDFL